MYSDEGVFGSRHIDNGKNEVVSVESSKSEEDLTKILRAQGVEVWDRCSTTKF